ncbi:MAG: hypothetical protein H6Q04_1028 [Acidobacteria bacterium]|nr:hypothetical protein [Acidobacteriota bacterium]
MPYGMTVSAHSQAVAANPKSRNDLPTPRTRHHTIIARKSLVSGHQEMFARAGALGLHKHRNDGIPP